MQGQKMLKYFAEVRKLLPLKLKKKKVTNVTTFASKIEKS